MKSITHMRFGIGVVVLVTVLALGFAGTASATQAGTVGPTHPATITISGENVSEYDDGGAATDELPDQHDFGEVPIGESADVQVRVEGLEESAVDVSDFEITGPDAEGFQVAGYDAEVGDDGSVSLQTTVSFSPQTPDGNSARLLLLDENGTTQYAVALSGTGLAPDVTVSRRSLSFTDATVEETSVQEVTVENHGEATLTVDNQRIKPGDGVFEIRSPAAEQIEPGESDTVAVAFEPESTAQTSATLSLSTNDPDDGTVPIFLSSSDVTANISVTEDEDETNVNADVEDVSPGEEVAINVPDEQDEEDTAGVDSISVTAEEGGDFSVDVTESQEPLDSSPEFEKETDPEQVGHMSIDHTVDNEDISAASVSYRISQEKLSAMESEPEDVTLYRHGDAEEWTATDTAFVRETDDGDYLFKASADGFSEWTAAAEVPRINVSDATANVSVATTQDTVEIDVLLNNTGGSDGRFETRLLLNGSVVDRRTVAVPPSSTSPVKFRRSFDQAGTYQVEVNRQFVAAIDVNSEDREAAVTGADQRDGAEATSGSGPLSPVLTVIALLAGGALARRKRGS